MGPRPQTALAGQILVVIGGSAGIGYATAQQARAEGATLIITARNRERLDRAARELDASGTAVFDARDPDRLAEFFNGLQAPVDHLLVSGSGPYYAPLAEMDFDEVQSDIDQHLVLRIRVAQHALRSMRPGGSLIFIGGTGSRRRGVGLTLAGAMTAAGPAMVENLALELAPTRVNLVAPGFVDTELSATLLGDGLEARREELRSTLPIRRVVGPDDVAALAVHLMTNTALTGGTYDVDGGQKLL
jgi:NAD(P)-dependent dehydrogenase (short-subunit alcohol dehydrogenase family)